ncbi:hypothetical protein RO07_20965 [Pandoraea pulmonicola]|uniref:Uncharacterized protein n=1 Tax=Pandoraea pulmonicola TaxID=93221 RepID=A0ABM5S3J5_PANPU|nr:hypothetical protein RO07_20965 [Pandoraea pulmonicola]
MVLLLRRCTCFTRQPQFWRLEKTLQGVSTIGTPRAIQGGLHLLVLPEQVIRIAEAGERVFNHCLMHRCDPGGHCDAEACPSEQKEVLRTAQFFRTRGFDTLAQFLHRFVRYFRWMAKIQLPRHGLL